MGPRLEAWRRERVGWLRHLASSLRSISLVVAGLMPPTVRRIAAEVNTAFMAALVDGLGWLDRELVQRFVHGFPIVGPVPDSGVYRRLRDTPGHEADARFASFKSTAALWNGRLHLRLASRASFSDIHLADPRALADAVVAAKTKEERAKGVVVGPYRSIAAVFHHLGEKAPPGLPMAEIYPRAMPRFAIKQGAKWRAIDDAKTNGANAATTMSETVTTPFFVYPAIVARAAADAALAFGVPLQPMSLALADLAMAYRTVPSSQPWYTVFSFFDQHAEPRPAPVYYYVPGHNFGLASAVVNFNRFPELVCVAARALAAVPAEHYYDDFIIPDLSAGGRTGISVVETLVLHLGRGSTRGPRDLVRAPEIDPGKTQEPDVTNIVLGVETDLSSAHTRGEVRFRATAARIAAILEAFEEAFVRAHLSPHEASSLRGKLYFLLSAAYGAVGRAATLPLVQRQYRDTDHSFLAGSELHSSLVFFRVLLPRLPDLVVSVIPYQRRPLTVYSDASFWVAKPRRGECMSREESMRGALGAVVYDPEDGSTRAAHARPDWRVLLPSWSHDQKTFIAELETLAAIAVYTTWPEMFVGRSVNHWIDNTVALSALVHGYSGKPSLAKPVNIFYLQMFSLRARVYFDWVPSKANIADLPSREMFDELRSELAGFESHRLNDHLVVPDVAMWDAPLETWADRFADLRPGSMRA